MSAVVVSNGDEASVHDLRTSIRRLSECLRTFADLFPGGEAGRLRRRLRKLMALAGEVRNRDIAGNLLVKAGVPTDDPLFDRLRAEKQEWQSALTDKVVAWTLGKRPKRWRSLLKTR